MARHRAASGAPKRLILEIQIVDDRGDSTKGWILMPNTVHSVSNVQRSALVAELDAEHVERHAAVRNSVSIGSESESRLADR